MEHQYKTIYLARKCIKLSSKTCRNKGRIGAFPKIIEPDLQTYMHTFIPEEVKYAY